VSGEAESARRFGRARAHVVSRHFLQKLTGLEVRVWQAGYTSGGGRGVTRLGVVGGAAWVRGGEEQKGRGGASGARGTSSAEANGLESASMASGVHFWRWKRRHSIRCCRRPAWVRGGEEQIEGARRGLRARGASCPATSRRSTLVVDEALLDYVL